jgi:hypothetical protein
MKKIVLLLIFSAVATSLGTTVAIHRAALTPIPVSDKVMDGLFGGDDLYCEWCRAQSDEYGCDNPIDWQCLKEPSSDPNGDPNGWVCYYGDGNQLCHRTSCLLPIWKCEYEASHPTTKVCEFDLFLCGGYRDVIKCHNWYNYYYNTVDCVCSSFWAYTESCPGYYRQGCRMVDP